MEITILRHLTQAGSASEIRCSRIGALLLAGLLTTTAVAAPKEALRWEGMDRLYFSRDQVADPGEVAQSLPLALRQSMSAPADDPNGGLGDELSVRDFPLPGSAGEPRRWIRQVTDARNTRIWDSWWALYDEERRGDVWHFAARPERTERKLLSNYRIESVLSAGDDRIVLRVRGEMFRPGGAWWISGKEFLFRLSPGRLALVRVRNVFGFSRSTNQDEPEGALRVSTERERDGAFELREFGPMPQAAAAACGFRDAQEEASSWTQLEQVARCLTDQPRATVVRRAFDSPSFVEKSR